MYKHTLALFFLLLAFSPCRAQDDWQLKSDKDHIKTYSKRVTDSKINAVKIESVFPVSITQLVSALADVGTYDKWIYNSRSTRLLKEVSPAELYYYSEVVFPWPTANRDFVSHMIITQDPHSRVVHINAENVRGWVPAKPNIVRIEKSTGEWIITPVSKNMVRIEYILLVDPAGGLPAWLINSFSSKGLVETFKQLREWLKKPAYASPRLSFIIE